MGRGNDGERGAEIKIKQREERGRCTAASIKQVF